MKKKVFSYLSTGTLVAGAAIGIFALVKSFLLKASLPAGACPIVSNRPFMYIAIALCVVSFVFSIVEQRFKIENQL